MRVVIAAVGKRTEHWQGFFEALVQTPELEVFVVAADVTANTRAWLESLQASASNFSCRIAPHFVSEQATGHMASVVFSPGSWRHLRSVAPDVLHVIGEPAYLSTYQAIRFRNRFWAGVPISHYAAQNVLTRLPGPFPWLERHAYRQIGLALPITPTALSVLRRKGYGGSARILPLGVDRKRFQPPSHAPSGPFTVGFVGRLERHKGIAELLSAAALIDCRLLVVGDGTLRAEIEAAAGRRANRVELVPWATHERLPQLLGRMHALALPSIEIVQRHVLPWARVPLREQFGRVLVEAMACGVPVVASRVGEIAHVLGDAALMIPPENDHALAHALTQIRDDAPLSQSLRTAGLARAEHFDWRQIADDVVDAWAELARDRA